MKYINYDMRYLFTRYDLLVHCIALSYAIHKVSWCLTNA